MGMVTRAGQIAVTLATSGADERFCGHIARADAARDCGDWGLAEAEYAAALRRFPLHWGYCIQYAHAIKEQGRFAHAEIWYRSAVALAAPADAVDEHLAFVCHSSGVAYQSRSVPDLAVPPLLAPPNGDERDDAVEMPLELPPPAAEPPLAAKAARNVAASLVASAFLRYTT